MKTIITNSRSLTQETEKLLNQQIAMEGKSSADYLAMASWIDVQGYNNAAKFLYDHAEEERAHMLKLFHYVNEAGGHALQPEIHHITYQFTSFKSVFEQVLSHEINVSKAIYDLVDHCLTIKDYGTFNFLQWFVTEQREEETIARRALELFNIIDETGIGLYKIDKEIGKLVSSAI